MCARRFLLCAFLVFLLALCIVPFTKKGVKRVELQSLHYFARPHQEILHETVFGPSAWYGEDLMLHEHKWKSFLTIQQLADIEKTLSEAADNCNLDLTNDYLSEDQLATTLSPLTLEQCPFGTTMSEVLKQWKKQLTVTELGFQVISGLPAAKWTTTKSSLFFWCLGLHLGQPGAQNDEGHVLGHVRDIGGNHEKERQFKSKGPITFHCDGADVVGLLALSKAKEGGTSRLVSSVSVYNEFLNERPDLIPELYSLTPLDTRGSGGVDYVWVNPIRYANGVLRTFWHESYFNSVYLLPNGPSQTLKQREAHELYSSILSRKKLWLDMDLEVGDIQLVSNHIVLHSRSGFTDFPADEDNILGIDRRRHLLRLWLSTEPSGGIFEQIQTEMSRVQVLFWLLQAKLRNIIL